MNGFFELDNNFVLPEGFDLSIFESLPIYKHTYGNSMEDNPTSLYWTEYQLDRSKYGAISFVRKLYLEHPGLAKYVTEYLTSLFYIIKFDYQRVGLLKTNGSVLPHFDESNRQCCINIGIKNSDIAVTRTSSTRDDNLFESQAKPFTCKDNHAYLLDTSCIHDVISLDDTKNRYLFTYGFNVPYKDILSCYKRKR